MLRDLGYFTIAAVRGKELPTRIGAAALIAACAWAIAPSPAVLVWLVAVMVTQVIDYITFAPLRRWGGGSLSLQRRFTCVFSSCVTASVFSSIALYFWFGNLELGKVLAMVFLAGGLLHVMLHMLHSRAIMIATAAGYGVQFLGLPLLDVLGGGHASIALTVGAELGALLYLVHLGVAVRHGSQTSRALLQARVDAERNEVASRMLFDRNPVALWLVDASNGELVDANAAAIRLLGRELSEMQGRSVLDLLHPDDLPLARERHAEGGISSANGLRDWRIQRPDGDCVIIRLYAQRVDANGRDGAICALVDVTERARHQVQLEQARDAAEAANDSKSAFLANMSHEIRTPLNGVVGVAELLAKGDLSPEQQEMVELIRSSGVTLERLLADVLDLARVESGHLEILQEPFDVAAVARGVGSLMRPRADEKGIALIVELQPDRSAPVLGDGTRVKQILTNLVSNAVKFTEHGEVVLTASSRDNVWCFQVRDTGVGFDSSAKEAVFGRFQQADGSITRRFGGTGLGLAISRELAERMGGKIDCESAPGRGSIFTVHLPLPPVEADTLAGSGAKSSVHKELGLTGVRVLLADDHPTNRKVVELIVAPLGVVIRSVENGAEALAALELEAFDIVLMDMQMPVLDGLAATRALREREAKLGSAPTPVLMLSANGMPEHIAAGKKAGADGYLIKPVTPASLLEALVSHLRVAAPSQTITSQAKA